MEWRAKDPPVKIEQRVKSAVEEISVALNTMSYDKVFYSAPEGPDGKDDWTREKAPVGRAKRTLEEVKSFIEALTTSIL